MKAVILAGGFGTRLSEETVIRPKPMVEIGSMPVIWHVMKTYSFYGVNDFIICCGYRAAMIKEYFADYFLRCADVTFDLQRNKMEVHKGHAEPWRVTLVDTGLDTMTGGRLKRVQDYVGDETFCFTYGDGLSDVNIAKLIEFHRAAAVTATVTAARHQSRFGLLHLDGDQVSTFAEKPVEEANWMNSGYFVLEPAVFDVIDGDAVVFEREPIHRLVEKKQLAAYRHEGFFMGMDSMRDKTVLEDLWRSGRAPWRVW
jgi:glucose-1-phosphate cytidylyltransferase